MSDTGSAPASALQKSEGTMRKRILIVDDSATVRLMEKMVLSKGPYELAFANDGEEAVAKAPQVKPDLILLDVVMPRLDGFETCRRLRAAEETRSTPIILVTTRGELQNMEEGYKAGCSDYLTKPVNGVELISKVKSLLGG